MARSDSALWSINERLGALCEALGARVAGMDLPSPSIDWAVDLLEVFKAEPEQDAPPDLSELEHPRAITQ